MKNFVLSISLLSVFLAAAIGQSDDVSVERIYHAPIGNGWTAHVLRNTIVEQGEPLHQNEEGFIRGGDFRTDVLLLMIANADQPFSRYVAWTHIETRRDLGLDFAGLRRTRVEDISYHDGRILILHIANNANRLSLLAQNQQLEWRVTNTFVLDVSQLASGQEVIGLTGRIVRVDNTRYILFRHSSLPGHLIYRVDKEAVAIEHDADVIANVIDASRKDK